ncbi:MAG TPA: NAD-binding protein [Dermatophilaceae bacterium]|nr:NAD-binding protein [Dermatophilaceae bacterium]
MGNPLLMLTTRPWRRGSRRPGLRRTAVPVPTQTPSTDAVFLVLRRMRAPLVVLIVVFAISLFGLSLIEGVDGQGRPYRMTVFDAFYFMSYTATTIGFGELPYSFTTTQRLWVTGSIYSSVIVWAYAIGTLFALLQDQSFREALATQRFRRRVGRIHEPFWIITGYGHAGRLVGRALDEAGRRFVVVDTSRLRVEALEADSLVIDVPALQADARSPAVLGLAGLGHPNCAGVLALSSDDEANLAAVMSVRLLRPQLSVIARCARRATAEHMREFEAHAVINPYDRYGAYLVLALHEPTTYQLVTWLTGPAGVPLPPRRGGLADGRWVVCADTQFGVEVVADLRAAGLEVVTADPADGDPDVTGAVGFVAGSDQDTGNLSMAAHARLTNPSVFLCIRQESPVNNPLLEAFDLDSVFIPTELVARETLARVITPLYWSFIEHALTQRDAWSQALIDVILQRCGPRAPVTFPVTLDAVHAPAIVRWLRGHDVVLADLLRHPEDREQPLAAVPLVLVRRERCVFLPDLHTPLREDDVLVFVGRSHAEADMSDLLFVDSTVIYTATGREVPQTWLWRVLTRRSTPADTPADTPAGPLGDASATDPPAGSQAGPTAAATDVTVEK